MADRAQAVFQSAFRSGVARAYNLSLQSNIINDPELFYSNFQQYVAIWNPNIPEDATSTFPGANDVIWDFPSKGSFSGLSRDLPETCVSSPFDSFGRAISCLTMPYVSLGLVDAPQSDLDVAAGYGVYADVTITASNTTKAWAIYLYETAEWSLECHRDVLIQNNRTLDLEQVSKCMYSLCMSYTTALNISADVIGIGVWTVYLIQLGICFLAPILAALFRQLMRVDFPSSCLGSRSSRSEGTSVQTDMEQKPSGGVIRNLEAAFITSLVDFQKAQCYYMMATQVASTTTLNRTSTDGTLVQWEVDSKAASVVSTLGILAPTTILFCLWILRQRSWYILLTVATSILSTYVFFDPRIMSVPDRIFINPGESGLVVAKTNPYSLCSVKIILRRFGWYQISTRWVFYLCGLVLVFLIVDHIFNLRLPRTKNRSYLLPYNKVQRSLDHFVIHLYKRGNLVLGAAGRRKVYKFACRFFLMGIMAVCFFVLVKIYLILYRYHGHEPISSSWTFGQIVSVAIWIPILVDWLQLSLRGMKSGSEYRMPHPYQVKRVGPTTSRPVTTLNFENTASEQRNSIELENMAFPGISRKRSATAEF